MKHIFPSYINLKNIKYNIDEKKLEIYVSSEEPIKEEVLIKKEAEIKDYLNLYDVDIIERYTIDENNIYTMKQKTQDASKKVEIKGESV
ncbi:MAG: hypothetical protein ACTTIX_06995, partial [Peptoanaerobacter stomatis]